MNTYVGDQENINSAIGVPPEIMARIHMFYRSSMIGRRSLGEELMTSIDPLDKFTYKDTFTNRNMEILQSYFKVLGIRIEFDENKKTIEMYDDGMYTFHHKGRTYLCTHEEFQQKKMELQAREAYESEKMFVGTKEEFVAQIQRDVESLKKSKERKVIRLE